MRPRHWYRTNKHNSKHHKKEFDNLDFKAIHQKRTVKGEMDLTNFVPPHEWLKDRAMELIHLEEMPPKVAMKRAREDWHSDSHLVQQLKG